MPWTTPQTWAAGPITSTNLNQQIRDNLVYLKAALEASGIVSDSALSVLLGAPYHVKARRTTNQSLNDNVLTSIQFTAADDFDSHSLHDPSTNSQRIIISGGDGYYLIGGGVWFTANATGSRQIYIELNGIGGAGTEIPGSAIRSSDAGGSAKLKITTSTIYPLVAGDYVALTAIQNSSGSLNVEDATFWAMRYAAV